MGGRSTDKTVSSAEYRRRVLAGLVEARLKEIIAEVGAEASGEVIEVEVMPDHVHLLVEVPPAIALPKLVQKLKSRSSPMLRAEFAPLRRLPSLWSPSWFVSTVGVPPRSGAPLRREPETGGVMAHRDRVDPTPDQLPMLARHCADARDVGNLALEHTHCDRPGRPMPGSAERSRQLAEARKGTWLSEGSSSVQQQALRDFDQTMRNWRAGTNRRPRWRQAGIDEGVCVRDVSVVRLNRRWATIQVPTCGPVRFRLSCP